MLANQILRRRPHRVEFERQMKPAYAGLIKRRAQSMVQQHVAVTALKGRVARAELRCHRLRPKHCRTRRQQRVGAPHPRRLRTLGIGIEMHDLFQRVHAGVGPAGTNRRHFFARDPGQRAFERVLHRAARRLRLPAAERGPVVFDSKRDAWHG